MLAFGFFHDERVTGRRLVGVAIGFVGVAVLVGAQPHAKLLGALAVVGMALCYAAGGLLTRRHLAWRARRRRARHVGRRGDRGDTGRHRAGAERRCPGGRRSARSSCSAPSCTAVAYLIFFTIIARAGAATPRSSRISSRRWRSATAAIFLGESVGGAALGGLVLILAGVTLGTRRAVRSPRPAAAPA